MGWWRTRWAKSLAMVGAVALLVVAGVSAAREVPVSVLAEAPPGLLAALAGLAVGNLLLTAALFWAITRSLDARPPVGLAEMTELIAASALLNYVPIIRPGLWGRAAYLKARHDLPLTQSVIMLAAIFALAIVMSAVALVMLVPSRAGAWGAFLGLSAALALATPALARRLLRIATVQGWAWVPLKAADLLVNGARLWLAFWIIGQPIGYEAAVLAAAASLLVKLAGITPNGLGLSEWVVAALAGAVAPVSAAEGVAAALVDRGAEVVVTLVTGLWGAWRLRVRGSKAVEPASTQARAGASGGE